MFGVSAHFGRSFDMQGDGKVKVLRIAPLDKSDSVVGQREEARVEAGRFVRTRVETGRREEAEAISS